MVKETSFEQDRRDILRFGLWGIGAFIGHCFFPVNSFAVTALSERSFTEKFTPLSGPDENGIRLPVGFSSRIVAQSSRPVFEYNWHAAPDGGATFATEDGGWIYVSNSEVDNKKGGASALKFDQTGKLIDAYPILTGTSRNCAGGATPWGTWLSCEEIPTGQVWECDPSGRKQAVLQKSLGRFMHEAVAVDHRNKQMYLTEDKSDGCLYRFTADNYPNLEAGLMEVAQITKGNKINWLALPDPQANKQPARYQLREATQFNGGEGIWYHDDVIYFTTRGDNRIWAYVIENNSLEIIYNGALFISPVLTGVDNITSTRVGELLVAEDGGDMQIVAITQNKNIFPILQVVGQDRSEITGPAFSPDGKRLYFSSQRGKTGRSEDGVTYEITGPFN
jgi:secreted PhoX family phosphatase